MTDRWADWLLRGRQRGFDDRQVRQMQRALEKLAKRVLKNAMIRSGQRVLDVGAGTGLIALSALPRVADDGLVVASDISHDALAHCREASGKSERLVLAVGDATALPFTSATFDVVTTRSVLIYLEDKAAGVAELHRVLKPGGRVSIFEPINDVWRQMNEKLRLDPALDTFRPTWDKIMDYYLTSESSRFLGWDERDLARWFEDAGFRAVKLEYEYTYSRPAPPDRVKEADRAMMRAAWSGRPNPYDASFEEVVRQILGAEADEWLERYLEFRLSQPQPTGAATAYLTARR